MKQKRRGFTLIELLAVIVILAIIALIAVPVIMNIISSTRKSAFEDTAYGLISAGEMYYAEKLLDPNGMTEEATFTFTDGAVSPSGLNVKGSLPKSGNMKITTEGKIALAITNGELCITKVYGASEIETTDEFESCELPTGEPKVNTLKDIARTNDFATEIEDCLTDGTACAVGTKFAIEVAPSNIKNFYVVSDESNIVTLLMDRNIGETVAWITQGDYELAGGIITDEFLNDGSHCQFGGFCSKNDKGPITALNYLETKTSSWANIAPKDFTLTDSVYGTMTRSNARARMLTITEANAIIDYDWSYGNLNSSELPYGYWTSSANADALMAWRVYSGGLNGYVDGNFTAIASDYGVRPVIELSK
ncbi:MAG: DUF1566 domain-containing protein [Firmicutes bacterium]|nr:DUF1566 domain-containing protein [Bacillota bacterium]